MGKGLSEHSQAICILSWDFRSTAVDKWQNKPTKQKKVIHNKILYMFFFFLLLNIFAVLMCLAHKTDAITTPDMECGSHFKRIHVFVNYTLTSLCVREICDKCQHNTNILIITAFDKTILKLTLLRSQIF